MHHVVIFLNILSLITGTWAFFYTHNLYNTFKINYIRDFKYFILFFNLNLISDLIIKYVITNLISVHQESQNGLLILICSPVGFALSFGMIFVTSLSIIAIAEFVVPKSIPTMVSIYNSYINWQYSLNKLEYNNRTVCGVKNFLS